MHFVDEVYILIISYHHQDEDGNKMINEYMRECKIGVGSYAKVVSIVNYLLFIPIQLLSFFLTICFIYEAGSV